MGGADAVDGADADGSTDGEHDDPEPTALEALRVTREESRAVLDHQVALLNEILDRTMRTVRLAGVMLGLVVSVVTVVGPTSVLRLDWAVLALVSLGVCSLFGCIFVGIGTYSISRMQFGVDETFREEVAAGSYDEREWLRDLLAAYDEWSGEMERTTERNGAYLLAAQLLLLVGISSLVAATALTAMAAYL